MDYLRRLFESDFMPHGHCYLWQPDVLWVNVGSDALIALAYYSIPIALFYFARQRLGFEFSWLLWMFGAFIFLCGTTHVLEIWTVWNGTYRLEGAVKLVTAGVSLATAVALWPVIPRALSLPSPEALATANDELRQEIARREGLETELRTIQADLEERVRQRSRAAEEVNQALTREIAERERAEERFREAVESAPSGMVMVNEDGRIVLVNQAAARIFGYEHEELFGQAVERLVPERFRAAHHSDRAAFLVTPQARKMGAGRDLYGLHRDGREIPVEIGLNPIETAEGLFVLSSVVDITERQHAERTIRDKNRELDEFARVVSHDLKAPLRGMTSLATWIVEDCSEILPEGSRENLSLLAHRAQRMAMLIDGVLEYSRLGRALGAIRPVDSHEVAMEVIDALASPAPLDVSIEGRLPVVDYDRTQLAQVFQNLIGNALRHHGKPQGVVVVSCRDRGDVYEFSVRDDGVGIEERQFDRIFKIFQTLAVDPRQPGTGIGLAIVKKLVELHGGVVSVASTPGEGADFRFSVPKSGAHSPGEDPEHGA